MFIKKLFPLELSIDAKIGIQLSPSQVLMAVELGNNYTKQINNRKKLTSSQRFDVWTQYCNRVYDHNCSIGHCKKTMSVDNFHVGHIVSLAKGGADHMSNMQPVCHNCNQSMGTMSIPEYEASIVPTPAAIKSEINKYKGVKDYVCPKTGRAVTGISDPAEARHILQQIDEGFIA